tara:strand:- start:686 stop:958 length:273 start_codon:yes stop_codon:yes gene_type:complete
MTRQSLRKKEPKIKKLSGMTGGRRAIIPERKSNHQPAAGAESYVAIPDVRYRWGHSISGATPVEADSAPSTSDQTSIAEDARVNHRKTFF